MKLLCKLNIHKLVKFHESRTHTWWKCERCNKEFYKPKKEK